MGGIPVTNVLLEMVTDGYMAVGDAAHQSDPLTAGGIGPSMCGGSIAGQVAVEAIEADDVSAKFLKKYEQMWDAQWGKTYRRLHRIRHALLKVPEDKLSQIIRQASRLDTKTMSLKDIALIAMKPHPQLMLEVIPYFLG